MSFPTNGILDSFTYANAGPPPSASWGNEIWIGDTGLRVVSNTLRNNTTPGGSVYWLTSFLADQEAYCVVTTKPADGSGLALYMRVASPHATFSGYEIGLTTVSGTDTLDVYRVNAEVETLLFSRSQEVASGDSIGATIIGSVLQLYYKSGAGAWNTLGASFTDSSPLSNAGFIGIGFGTASGSTTAVDDFGGGSLYTLFAQALL